MSADAPTPPDASAADATDPGELASGDGDAHPGGMDHRRERIRVETERHRIIGYLTLARDGYRSRVSDVLNAPERDFLTLTEVSVEPLSARPRRVARVPDARPPPHRVRGRGDRGLRTARRERPARRSARLLPASAHPPSHSVTPPPLVGERLLALSRRRSPGLCYS